MVSGLLPAAVLASCSGVLLAARKRSGRSSSATAAQKLDGVLGQTLYDVLPGVDSYSFYPIGVNSDLDIAPRAGGPEGQQFNLYLESSITSAHYYNVVVHLMLTYFGCTPPAGRQWWCWWCSRAAAPVVLKNGTVVAPGSGLERWTCPPGPPCEENQEGCQNPGAKRIRPCFKDSPSIPQCMDFRALVLDRTSSTSPCNFERANAQVSGRSWTSCAAILGLDSPRLWNDTNVLNGLSFMFDNNIPREAAAVGGGRDPAPVAVAGMGDLAGAALCAFSFGSGYICPDFAGCEQPGLTNTALAAAAIAALPHLTGAAEAAAGQTHFLMQWETAAAAAELLGLARGGFVGNENLSSSCTTHGAGDVCVWKVGDGGAYLSTSDIYRIIAGKISELGISKLVQLAAPDHLPRVYRTGLRELLDTADRVTLYPALIPYTHNYPVSSQAAVVNLYAGSPFLQGPNFGLYPDNPQDWVRNRVVFRLYELMANVWAGGTGLYHVPVA